MTQMLVAVVVVLTVVVGGLCVMLLRVRSDVRELVDIHEVEEAESDLQPVTLEPQPGLTRPPQDQPIPAGSPVTTSSAAARSALDEEVPVITELTESAGSEPPALTTARVASVTLARPLIKAAALVYGVRRALDQEHRIRIQAAFSSELRRQRKLRRRAVRATPVTESGS